MLETNVTLPSKPRIIKEEDSTGIYEIDGLFPGYGHTLGNSLRRIVLSSLPGAAITQVKIEGVKHEFETLEGLREDVLTVLLNLKRVRLSMHQEEPLTIRLNASKTGTISAKDIECPSQIEILNKDQHIAEITKNGTKLDIEMTVERGLGYVPREIHQKEKVDIGTIALDAVFTPIRRANYEVENMRVGDRTDFNRLRLFIETDGTITPHEALEQSIEIMIHQLKAVVGFQETESKSESQAEEVVAADSGAAEPDPEMMKTRIDALNLSSRTLAALEEASIRTLGGLVRKKKNDILELDGIGPKGLDEIVELLDGMGITLEE